MIAENLHRFICLTTYYDEDKNVKDGLVGKLARTEKKCTQNICGKYLKERNHREDLSIDGNTLKCRVGLVWMRIGISGGIFVKTFEH